MPISVYDAPELTRTVRVGADGFMRLPMLKQRIKAEGLMPGELEAAIAAALVAEQLMVDPFVTVTIAEYNSRPISVAGAVRAADYVPGSRAGYAAGSHHQGRRTGARSRPRDSGEPRAIECGWIRDLAGPAHPGQGPDRCRRPHA